MGLHIGTQLCVEFIIWGLLFISMVKGAQNIEGHVEKMVQKQLMTETDAQYYKETLLGIVVEYEEIKTALQNEYEDLDSLENIFTTQRSEEEFVTWLQNKNEPTKYLPSILQQRIHDFINLFKPLPVDAVNLTKSVKDWEKLPGGERYTGYDDESKLFFKKCHVSRSEIQRETMFGILTTLYEPQLFANVYGYIEVIVNDEEESYILVTEKYQGDINVFFQPKKKNETGKNEMDTKKNKIKFVHFIQNVGNALERLYITHYDIHILQIFYTKEENDIVLRLGDFGKSTFHGLNPDGDFNKDWPTPCNGSFEVHNSPMYLNPYLWKSKPYEISATKFFDITRTSHHIDQYALGMNIYELYCFSNKETQNNNKDYDLRLLSTSKEKTEYSTIYYLIWKNKEIYDECIQENMFSHEQIHFMNEHVISVWKSFLELKQNMSYPKKRKIEKDIEFLQKYYENKPRSKWIWSLIIISIIGFMVLFAEMIHKKQYFCDKHFDIDIEEAEEEEKEEEVEPKV